METDVGVQVTLIHICRGRGHEDMRPEDWVLGRKVGGTRGRLKAFLRVSRGRELPPRLKLATLSV
jgi:hypothetical protein